MIILPRYESKMKKFFPGMKVVDRPVVVSRGAPSLVFSSHPDNRMYEWQDHATLPIDRTAR